MIYQTVSEFLHQSSVKKSQASSKIYMGTLISEIRRNSITSLVILYDSYNMIDLYL